VRCVARWLAVFRPSPLKTGPSEARTTPIVNGDCSKFFVHFHTTFAILDPNGVGGYVERQDWARRTGQGARRSRTGVGAQREPRDAGRHVELRQGLYGGMAYLGACCALRLPARGWSRASPRGDSPRQAARGLHGGATGAPLRGERRQGGGG